MKSVKKITFATMLAATVLMVASCSNEKAEITGPVGNQPINLIIGTEGGAELSRATPITASVLPASASFSLSAIRATSKVAHDDLNQKTFIANATGNAVSDWGTYYWPVGEALKFYSYYPTIGNAKGNLSVNHTMSVPNMVMTYTVNKDFASQDDLLYAYSQNSSGDVSLTFKHALTRVTFQCSVINAAAAGITSLTVTNITFNNALWTAPLTIDAAGTATWGLKSGKANYAYTLTGAKALVPGTNDATPDVSGTARTDESQFTNVFSSTTNNSFIMLPMTNSEFSTNATTITVAFSINGGAKTKTGTITLKDQLSGAHEWPMGKWVNYRMTFDGTKETNPLVVNTISVTDWGTMINVPVDIN